MITYNDIKHNENIRTYIKKADESLVALGYTEHNFAHVTKVAVDAAYILETLGYCEHERQIGQTGVTVRPALFIPTKRSVGISAVPTSLVDLIRTPFNNSSRIGG